MPKVIPEQVNYGVDHGVAASLYQLDQTKHLEILAPPHQQNSSQEHICHSVARLSAL